ALAATDDPQPLAGNRALLHHERDEPSLRAGLLDAADHVGAGEVLSERAGPAEAGGDRIGLRSDVVPVQREARLEAQRVAGAETACDDAAREDGIPERARVLGHAEQLAAVLAGVAGAVHHRLDPVDRSLRERERPHWQQAEA